MSISLGIGLGITMQRGGEWWAAFEAGGVPAALVLSFKTSQYYNDGAKTFSDLMTESGTTIDSSGIYIGSGDTLAMITVLSGNELNTNGTFDTDTSGWTVNSNASIAAVADQIVLTQLASAVGSFTQEIPTVVGRTCRCYVDAVADAVTGSAFLKVGTAIYSSDLGNLNMLSILGTHSLEFIATGATSWVTISSSSLALIGESSTFDNVTTQELVPFVGYDQDKVSGKITLTPNADGTLGYISYNDTTANETIEVYQDASNNIKLKVVDGGVTQCDIDSGVNAVIGTEVTIAFRAGVNDFAISVDGNAEVTDGAGTMPVVTQQEFGTFGLCAVKVAYNELITDLAGLST